MIGLFSDSGGDLEAFDRAYELLRARGAKRFFFTGGQYADLDGWIRMRKERARAERAGETAFLTEVTRWLSEAQPSGPGAAPAGVTEWNADNIREQFTRTPEKGSPEYSDDSVQRKVVELIGDVLCCIVYDKNDLDRDDILNASIFVHGQSQEAKVVQIGPRFFVTPGSLGNPTQPSCALIDDSTFPLFFSAFSLEGNVLVDKQPLVPGGGPKLSVK